MTAKRKKAPAKKKPASLATLEASVRKSFTTVRREMNALNERLTELDEWLERRFGGRPKNVCASCHKKMLNVGPKCPHCGAVKPLTP